jgi:hypothetical protein
MEAIIVGIHNRKIVCIISSGGDYAVRIVFAPLSSLSESSFKFKLYYVNKFILFYFVSKFFHHGQYYW